MPRILFVHPDLGIGGAERLVIDAALALKAQGHTVSFLTNHHDRNHCFKETIDGSLIVKTVGDWIPRNLFGKFNAFFAYLRMIYSALYTVFYLSKEEKIDIIFCDQISLGNPIFRFAENQPKILFYCHFPDQLLAKPGNLLKQLYRAPLNYLEEKTTGMADGILVNSKFTRRVFKDTFKGLDIVPDVLYPSLVTDFFDKTEPLSIDDHPVTLKDDTFVFLSINRFERKKNLGLALTAFKFLENNLTKNEWDRIHLIIAGGYDPHNQENIDHFEELNYLARELNLDVKVTFLKSPSDQTKIWLLKRCQTLVYTPENEHFGIVPLEGMYLSKPVIAVNSGGPTETIIDNSTGFLCDPKTESFANAMKKFINDRTLIDRMGEMGRKRVAGKFSFAAFSEQLNVIVGEMLANGGDGKGNGDGNKKKLN